MEYQNTDELARKEACERVKQIVKAIKAIKIKYYLNFSKISSEDQEKYRKLETNLEKISEDYNLNNLKVALMAEVDAKYDRKDLGKDEQGGEREPDDMLQACYGAIDAQVNALSKGKIKTASECQNLLHEYMKQINSPKCQALILYYKREKFAELMRSRGQVDGNNDKWIEKMREFYEKGNAEMRDGAIDAIKGRANKTVKTIDEVLGIGG